MVAEKRKAEMLMINPLDITRLCDKAKRAKLHAALHSQDREYDLQKAARQVSDAKADVLDAAVELGNSMQRERVAQPAAHAAAEVDQLAERVSEDQQRARWYDECHPLNIGGVATCAQTAALDCGGNLSWVEVLRWPSHPKYAACRQWFRRVNGEASR